MGGRDPQLSGYETSVQPSSDEDRPDKFRAPDVARRKVLEPTREYLQPNPNRQQRHVVRPRRHEIAWHRYHREYGCDDE